MTAAEKLILRNQYTIMETLKTLTLSNGPLNSLRSAGYLAGSIDETHKFIVEQSVPLTAN